MRFQTLAPLRLRLQDIEELTGFTEGDMNAGDRLVVEPDRSQRAAGQECIVMW